MRRMFVYAAVLALGIAPAFAEKLYVPVLGATGADGRALATQLWVTNLSKGTRAVATQALRDGATGETRSFDVARGGRLIDLGTTRGLVAIDANETTVSAWLANTGADDVAEVPVIGSHDRYHAGAQPTLADFAAGADRVLVGAANLDDSAATCQATLFSASHRELARIPFEVAAMSVTHEDAAAWTSQKIAYAQVTCNRDFYPIGVASSQGDTKVVVAKSIGPNGPCNHVMVPVRQPDGTYTLDLPGVFHQTTLADPKAVVCIRAPSDITTSSWRVGRLVVEWDVTTGPWWAKKPSGIHNMGYFFTNRYRSGVIGNVNALGPGKYLVKNMQNVGMPAGSNTSAKGSYHINTGVLYHPVYTFDANNQHANTTFKDANGAVLKTLDQVTHPGGQSLTFTKYANAGFSDFIMVAEFGNYNAVHTSAPEVPNPGWVDGNLHLHFFPK